MNKSANKPNKHHFLPVFYLSQWAGTDHKIVRFTKPYGNLVKPFRIHPDGAGYIERLYAFGGLPEEARQDLETEFLSPVDSRAAVALKSMLSDKKLTPDQRLAWAEFIATLLFRMPDDIEKIKENIASLWSSLIPGLEKIYNALPLRYRLEAFNNSVDAVGRDGVAGAAIDTARRLMSNGDVVAGLAALEWSVLKTDGAKHEILTSDRPIAHSHSLNHAESHLIVPIGPRRLFVAVKDRQLIAKVKSVTQDKLVRAVNEFVVSNATVTVCGRTDSQLNFIQRRMGVETQPSLLSKLPEMQKTVVAEFMETWEVESTLIARDIPQKLIEVERRKLIFDP